MSTPRIQPEPSSADVPLQTATSRAFADYFKCPPELARLDGVPGSPGEQGFFTFGQGTGWGRHAASSPSPLAAQATDLSEMVRSDGVRVVLPFDLGEIVTNLREERYPHSAPFLVDALAGSPAVRDAYYRMRPVLGVVVRRHLQRLRLMGWHRIPFPRWPVDTSVDTIMWHAMGLLLRQAGVERIPFIWFWPDGVPSMTMMTHDVEARAGQDFCHELMAIDESFGVKSSFQLVPQDSDQRELAARMRRRGFEVNLHDFNHDGRLFWSRQEFLCRVAHINKYARDFGCSGFRSGSMYRQQEWLADFELDYDMSVPNVAHLEPQRGGCCTVMPYFVGRVLELPLTTTQDYSLFHIIGDYSVDLWKTQIATIVAAHGLVSFITHPDYLLPLRARRVYVELLEYLSVLRQQGDTWIALPSEINAWWRNRQAMRLVRDGTGWRICGPGSARARLAYAGRDGAGVTYELA